MEIIKYIISFIVGLLLLGFIINFVAVRIRYFFLKLIGKKKSIEYLAGDSDDENQGPQGFYNLFIGLIIIVLLMVLGGSLL